MKLTTKPILDHGVTPSHPNLEKRLFSVNDMALSIQDFALMLLLVHICHCGEGMDSLLGFPDFVTQFLDKVIDILLEHDKLSYGTLKLCYFLWN